MKQCTSIISLTFFLICLQMANSAWSQNLPARSSSKEKLEYPELVNQFYLLNDNNVAWAGSGTVSIALREELLRAIDSSYYWGMLEKKYHRDGLQDLVHSASADSAALRDQDRLYTDAAIAMCKDIYQGYKTRAWVGFDQLSNVHADRDNEYILKGLIKARTAEQLRIFFASLEPEGKDYALLKSELGKQLRKNSVDTVRLLQLSMNYYRWIHHFNFERLIVVNIPSARLRYYEKDSVVLDMKVVLGQASTPTPRFATLCDQAILYPYWYVPPSIIFNEYLPKIKNNPSWLDAHNMQVIDSRGKVMDHHQLNWSSFGKGNFSYSIRQSTGCDNALGVIKFNISTPYGVYLHDTNNKTAFLLGLRYLSHGCIRIEQPMELGNRLLNGQLDTAFLQFCFKEQKPVIKRLDEPVPVFAVYMPVVPEKDGRIRYYKDIYKLLK